MIDGNALATSLAFPLGTISIYVIGGIIFFSSLMIALSYQAHIDEGLKVVPYLLHLPLLIGVPILLLITPY
ncbi:hypothetical protein ACFWDG_20615, partial [Peribacillus sp. NPDC060186]